MTWLRHAVAIDLSADVHRVSRKISSPLCKLLCRIGWIHAFTLFGPNSDPTTEEIETHQSNFSIIQFRWASFNGSLSFLLLSDWSGAVFCCCSPSASRFTIRDALLQNSVVTSCYLCSYQIKTVWLFSSDLNIFTQELTLFSIFLDRYRWSDGCVGQAHPEMLRPTTMPHLTSLHSPCFFILRIILNFSR